MAVHSVFESTRSGYMTHVKLYEFAYLKKARYRVTFLLLSSNARALVNEYLTHQKSRTPSE